MFIHGMRDSREYESWCRAKARCYSVKNNRYHSHGGRGIIMCDEWKNSFEQFYKDMGNRPIGTSIERKDNDGNYEPGNCIWATPAEQSKNRRSSHFVEVLGKTLNVIDAEKILGIHRSSINQKVSQSGKTYQQATDHFTIKKLNKEISIVENAKSILQKCLAA